MNGVSYSSCTITGYCGTGIAAVEYEQDMRLVTSQKQLLQACPVDFRIWGYWILWIITVQTP